MRFQQHVFIPCVLVRNENSTMTRVHNRVLVWRNESMHLWVDIRHFQLGFRKNKNLSIHSFPNPQICNSVQMT